MVGVLAGLVWSIVIGLPLVATVAWATLDLGWRNSVAMYGAFLALAAILGGLYFGRKIAKLTAKQAAISRDGRWLLASWKDWLAPLLIVGAVLTLNVDNFLAAVPMAVAFTVIAGVFVALLRPAVWPVTPRWAVVLTALAAGLAPMAAAVVVFLAAREWLERSQEVMALFVSAAAFFSFLACTRVMSLAETTRAQPIGEARPVPKVIRTLTQVAIGLAALALIPLHVSAFGTPWRTLASAAIVADQPIPLPSTASGYFKVSNPADHPQWYEVKGLPDEAELSVRKEQNGQHHSHVLEQTLLLLVPGTTVGSIVQPEDKAQAGQITLHPLPDLVSGTTIVLSETERTPFLLKLTKDEHTGTWKGAWASRIQGAPEGSSLLMVFPETSTDLTGEITDLDRRKASFGIPARSFSASYPRATDKTYNGLIYSLKAGEMDITLHASFQNGGPAAKDIYVPVLMSLNTEAKILYDEGSNLLQAQKYIEALPKLEAAAKLSPDNDESLNNFAWALVAIATTTKSALDPRALEHAKEAVKLAPSVPNYYDTLAHAEYLSGNMSAARDAWATVYKLSPGYDDSDPLCARDKKIFEDLKKQGGITK